MKVKIVDAKINKKLVGDELEVSKVIGKTNKVNTKSLANKTTKQILLAFIERQEQLWQEQREFNKFVIQQFKAHGWVK